MLKDLISFLSNPKRTKFLVIGAPTQRHKPSSWDLRNRRQVSKPARPTQPRSRHSSIQHRDPFRISQLACSSCKERAAKGNRQQCINYLCRSCGERAITRVVNDRGWCSQCLQHYEAGMLEVPDTMSWQGSSRDVLNPLAALRTVTEELILGRAREGIGATRSSSGSISSMRAVIGHPQPGARTTLLRGRLRSDVRKLGALNFSKVCDNQGCGNWVVCGDDITIRTCSEDSLILVDLGLTDSHHNELVNRGPVVFSAAQIGSPTGYAQFTWPSPKLKPTQRSTSKFGVPDMNSPVSKQPLLLARRDAELPALLEEAMKTPISLPRISLRINAPSNAPEEHDLQLAATNRQIAMTGRGSVDFDEISELDISAPAHPYFYKESRPTDHWLELLDFPREHSSKNCSPPPSLLVKQSCRSLDYRLECPESLQDSAFCNKLVQTLYTPASAENRKNSQKPTGKPLPNYPFGYSGPKVRPVRRKFTYSASSSLQASPPPSPKLKPALTKPTPYPPPIPCRSADSLMLDSNCVDHIQYPHSREDRTPSPIMTPYPSLESSVTTLAEGRDEARGLEATIHPRGYTLCSRANSPGLEEWSNESVFLFSTTPELTYVSNGKTVKISSRGRKNSKRDSNKTSKSSEKARSFSKTISDYDNKNGSTLLKRGGGKGVVEKMKEKVTDIFWDLRERKKIKKDLRFFSQAESQHKKKAKGNMEETEKMGLVANL